MKCCSRQKNAPNYCATTQLRKKIHCVTQVKSNNDNKMLVFTCNPLVMNTKIHLKAQCGW